MNTTSIRRTLCLLLAVVGSAVLAETINLGVGMQKVLNLPGVTRVLPGDPQFIDVRVVGNQIVITGVGEGKTSLTVWKGSKSTQYTISVRKQELNDVMSEVRKLLGDIEGVTVRSVGDKIYLDGQAYTQQDSERIDQVVGLYPNVKSFVRIAANAKMLTAQNLTSSFQRSGLRNVSANVIGSTIFLEGFVENQSEKDKAEMIIKATGEKVENLIAIGLKRMILSEIQFVEVRTGSLDTIGIKWPTNITGNVNGTIGVSKIATGPLDLSMGANLNIGGPNLTFAFGGNFHNGYARLLAQPRLVCASGEKSEFLAGGEVPIPLISQNSAQVIFKPYGIILKISPTADRLGNIQTEVEAEVSEVDDSVGVSVGLTQVPGFRTRRVKTNVTVRQGETIVLSGVFADLQQKEVDKVPGLGNIPIIGEFFKNRKFDNKKQELVIFVTPRIVTPISDQIQTLIDEAKTHYREASSDVTFNVFD